MPALQQFGLRLKLWDSDAGAPNMADGTGPSITDWITAGTAVIGTIVLVGVPTLRFLTQRARAADASLTAKLDPADRSFSVLRLAFKPARVRPAKAVIQVMSPDDVEVCAPKASTDPDQTVGPWVRAVEMSLFNQPADTLRTDVLTRSANGAVTGATYRVTIKAGRAGRRLLRRVVTLS
jgi:hypothetical protein